VTLIEAIEAIVGRITARVDYHALYPARVLQQRADGTLDLVPDSMRVPSCQRVPYRTLRGLSVEVSAGARVLLGYEEGDPSKPYAALWELGDADVVRVNGGTSRVARDGEDVVASAAMVAWMAAVVAKVNGGAGVVGAAPSTIGAVSGGAPELLVP